MLSANDLGGEAFLLLEHVAGVDTPYDEGLASVEPNPLCLRLPEKEGGCHMGITWVSHGCHMGGHMGWSHGIFIQVCYGFKVGGHAL